MKSAQNVKLEGERGKRFHVKLIWALSFDVPNISEGYIVRYTHNITFQKIEMYSKKIIARYIASILVFATVKKPKVYILRRLQNTIKKAEVDYSELIGALWMCCNMVVAVYLLIRTYQQLYALIKSGKCVFFTCDYIDSYDGSSKKNCNKLSAIFFHLAKLVSKYVSDHTTFRYIGEIKTRSADLNFMEVGSLANILARFTKHRIMSSI